ncbi:DUF4166 domain-containing protein [Pleionea sediminis]|uniref:DUF4166 domain-containing protein n=1 Tax=Pleionea sediminis TaxID=2569479 RepID=UPI0011849D31|nr:DUF4166 domain-containing protein [Pleionea sediminis]
MTYCPPKLAEKNKSEINSAHSYRTLMGEVDWNRLHPAIKQRFEEKVSDSVTYSGVMRNVYLSFAGKVLAQVCRLIGTPLALYEGNDVPMTVNVYPDQKQNGMTWDRFYHYPTKPVNRVKSTKCILKDEGLVELVGFGFGMKLKVYEKEHAMYFESTEFFLLVGNKKLVIPDWLTPGKTLVYQRALDDQRFEFGLDVTHKWLGKVFHQVGEFVARN